MAVLESCLGVNKADRHVIGMARVRPYKLLMDWESLNKGVRGFHPKL